MYTGRKYSKMLREVRGWDYIKICLYRIITLYPQQHVKSSFNITWSRNTTYLTVLKVWNTRAEGPPFVNEEL